jgi:hypothetical protein
MPTLEQEVQARKKLKDLLDGLNSIDPDSLARTDILGQALSFQSGVPIFRRTLALFRELSECNLDETSFSRLNQLADISQSVWNQFQAIKSFSVEQNPANPTGRRDQLLNELRDAWDNYYAVVTPQIAYSKGRATDYSALEREARGTLSLMKDLTTSLTTEKDKGIAEIQGALERVRRAAAEAGVAQHAIHFSQESQRYQREAWWWLAASVLFAGGTVAYALIGLSAHLVGLGETATVARVVQAVIPRIIVISILSFGLVWAARNYSASRHNLVVNRHRQNALSTFETFVKAAGDAQTKDAVLIQATQSIFSAQPSGFIRNDPEPGSNQIVEIVRNLAGHKE